MSKILYLGDYNNGVTSYFGEAALTRLQQRVEIARADGWRKAHEAMPHTEAIATFVDEFIIGYWRGYATGTTEELRLWIVEHDLEIVQSGVGNCVPFSNGSHYNEADRVLTDAQFLETFGFTRPVDAKSQPHRRSFI